MAGQVSVEWQELEEKDSDKKERLLKMAKEIVPYHMAHNAEAEACDLLMEIERLDLLQDYVDESAYSRVCLYLTRYKLEFVGFVLMNSYEFVFEIYLVLLFLDNLCNSFIRVELFRHRHMKGNIWICLK